MIKNDETKVQQFFWKSLVFERYVKICNIILYAITVFSYVHQVIKNPKSLVNKNKRTIIVDQ